MKRTRRQRNQDKRRRKDRGAGSQAAPQLRSRQTIEAEMEEVMQQLATDAPAEILEQTPTYKKVSLSPTMVKMLRLQQELFHVVFGRAPGPTDPVFWDHEREDEGPQRMVADNSLMEKHALMAGVRPAMAYAMRKTGRIVTQANHHLLSDDELQEWEDAVAEYGELS